LSGAGQTVNGSQNSAGRTGKIEKFYYAPPIFPRGAIFALIVKKT